MGAAEQAGLGVCPACRAEGVKLVDMDGLMICEKCTQKKFSSKVRKTIQEAYERQQEQKHRQMWQKRMDLVKRGLTYNEKGQLQEAVQSFTDYLGVLESKHGMGRGQLHPQLFASKKKEDAAEILLIAGVYWDMAKIYDRAKNQQNEMRSCLNKFVEFSIDRPHLMMACENVRKYMGSGKNINVTEFKNAHLLMRSRLKKCFIATVVYGDDSPQVETLRIFRDDVLQKTLLGRAFVSVYYKTGYPIAKQLLKSDVAIKKTRNVLDVLVWLVK